MDGGPRTAQHAYEAAREAGDVAAMTAAALALASGRGFGTFPGQVPALLHQAYALASGAQRARVAAALARAWVYGGVSARAAPFAAEAVALAGPTGDAALLADALDAQLSVHWGPDDLAERVAITGRLDDVALHLTDVEVRLSAHLWRLTTAVETLDLPAVQRQVRALDDLAEESGSARVRFFAAALRGACTRCSPVTSLRSRPRERQQSPPARRQARRTWSRSSANYRPVSPARPGTAPR